MFVGYSEVSISFLLKIRNMSELSDLFVFLGGGLLRFSVSGGQKKLLGCGLLQGDQYPG